MNETSFLKKANYMYLKTNREMSVQLVFSWAQKLHNAYTMAGILKNFAVSVCKRAFPW